MSEIVSKVGIGIVTCDRLDYLKKLYASLKKISYPIDHIVVVNDGKVDITDLVDGNCTIINNDHNIGVGKSKNKCMQFLLENRCDYIFILEDDIIIKEGDVFAKYIEASRETGIQHFNYGPGTPFNRIQTISNYDLHNRHSLDNKTKPNPKLTIQYKNNITIDLYEHVAGVFSFFTRRILEVVGLHDEQFYNAWEHVDHTYRIITQKGHPPFWWFADIHNSDNYLSVPSDSIEQSSTAKDKTQWFENIRNGREYYKSKHGFYPNTTPATSKDTVLSFLKEVKLKWTT